VAAYAADQDPVFSWEQIPIDAPMVFGAHALTEAAIVAFAIEWDPQPWHLDTEAAAASVFGEIVACAAHLFAIVSKLMLDCPIRVALLAGLGNRDLRLVAPGRVGDVLSMRLTYTAARASSSRPGTGVVDMLVELIDQDERVVLRNEGSMLVTGNA